MIRRRFRVRGRVQGVGFRRFVERQAQQLGVGGHVRNLPDGRVECEAEGPAAAVDALAAALQQGPPLARVLAVEATDLPLRHDRGFSIDG